MAVPLLAIGSLAAGIGSSIWGSSQAAKEAEEARKQQLRQRAARDAQIRLMENRSEADTARGQNVIRVADEAGREAVSQGQGETAMTGDQTAAAKAKEARTKMIAEATAQLASGDTARQDRASQMKAQAAENDAAADMALAQQKAQSQMQLAAGVSDAFAGAASNFMGGGTKAAATPTINNTVQVDTAKLWDAKVKEALDRMKNFGTNVNITKLTTQNGIYRP